jgi:hypothetical protein
MEQYSQGKLQKLVRQSCELRGSIMIAQQGLYNNDTLG